MTVELRAREGEATRPARQAAAHKRLHEAVARAIATRRRLHEHETASMAEVKRLLRKESDILEAFPD